MAEKQKKVKNFFLTRDYLGTPEEVLNEETGEVETFQETSKNVPMEDVVGRRFLFYANKEVYQAEDGEPEEIFDALFEELPSSTIRMLAARGLSDELNSVCYDAESISLALEALQKTWELFKSGQIRKPGAVAGYVPIFNRDFRRGLEIKLTVEGGDPVTVTQEDADQTIANAEASLDEDAFKEWKQTVRSLSWFVKAQNERREKSAKEAEEDVVGDFLAVGGGAEPEATEPEATEPEPAA